MADRGRLRGGSAGGVLRAREGGRMPPPRAPGGTGGAARTRGDARAALLGWLDSHRRIAAAVRLRYDMVPDCHAAGPRKGRSADDMVERGGCRLSHVVDDASRTS